VYARTPFLAAATHAGRPTLDGAGMLLHQGALAFEWWTGRRAPLGAMVLALRGAGLALSRPR
jgi:shikimate dehydrogenase